jgi:hypothetical protein
MLISINKAFKNFDPRKVKVTRKEQGNFDPVAVNNCLITAINGGRAASYANVLMIRYLIFDQLEIPYGAFLPASPEVIYIIVKTLAIRPARIEIYGEESAPYQVFIVASNYNIIELEGDEAGDIEEEEDSVNIRITHSGGNHFSYRRTRGRSRRSK